MEGFADCHLIWKLAPKSTELASNHHGLSARLLRNTPAEHIGFETVDECCRYGSPAWWLGAPALPSKNCGTLSAAPQRNDCDMIPLIPLHCRVYHNQFWWPGINYSRKAFATCIDSAWLRDVPPKFSVPPVVKPPHGAQRRQKVRVNPVFDFGSACFSCILAFANSGVNLPSSPLHLSLHRRGEHMVLAGHQCIVALLRYLR